MTKTTNFFDIVKERNNLIYDDTTNEYSLKPTKGILRSSYRNYLSEYGTIPTSEYKINNGDKLYFYKGCNILRDKIRSYSAANGDCLSITIKSETADAYFVGDDTINYLLEKTASSYEIYKKELINTLRLIDNTEKVINDLNNANDESIMMSYHIIGQLKESLKSQKKENHDFNYSYAYYSSIRYTDLYNELKSHYDNGGIFYDDKSLLKILNNELSVLDENNFEQIELMLMSTDENNVKLAAEMMANSDPIKSAYELAYFLCNYDNKLHYSGMWNSVNFKSLRNCFDQEFQYSQTLDVINYCTERHLIGDHNINLIKKHIKKEFDSKLDFRLKNLIVIDKISLGKPVISSIKSNRSKINKTEDLEVLDAE